MEINESQLLIFIPRETEEYGVELVRLYVCLSVSLDMGYFVHASLIWRNQARTFIYV